MGGSTGPWGDVPMAPPDPVIGITEAFKADTDHRKLNLGVGAYRTEEGKPLVLNVVKKAEQLVAADPSVNKEYLPIAGDGTFCKLSRELAFGKDSAPIVEGRVATVQGLSGTGSLRIGAEFLGAHYHASREAYVPRPTWPNHKNILAKAGLTVKEYTYFKADTRGLDYEALLADLRNAQPGAIVVLHACAHNPTGVDPTQEQWRGILAVVQERGLLPFFDSAYQGFASGDLNADAWSLRLFAQAGVPLLLAQSYAKNLGLYGERVGALSVVTSSPDEAKRVESQLKQVIRPMYSNPPMHGELIASRVLGDPALFEEWKVELKGMADRIGSMRQHLYDALQAKNLPGDWSFVLKQIGMFSYTGLTRAQCEWMTSHWHVYLTMDGRISMAGLSANRCAYLADAIADSFLNH